MDDEQLNEIIEALRELAEDNTVPRNIKQKVEEVIKTLNENSDISMKKNKALSDLDEISDDCNLQSYTRTQIWNIASLLEML